MGWKMRKDKLQSDQADTEVALDAPEQVIESDAGTLSRLAQAMPSDNDSGSFVLDLDNDTFRTDTRRTTLDPSAFSWFPQEDSGPGDNGRAVAPSPRADAIGDLGRKFGSPASHASPVYVEPQFDSPLPSEPARVDVSRPVEPTFGAPSYAASSPSLPEAKQAVAARGYDY